MVTRLEWRPKLIGLSTETKPLDEPNGTLFLEVNTGDLYILYGGTWYEVTIAI